MDRITNWTFSTYLTPNETNNSNFHLDLRENIASFDRIFEIKTELALLIAYLTLLIFGFVSNAIIILLFCATNFNQRESRSLLFTNLALSDAIYCLFFCPFTLHNILRKSWPFPELLCKIVPTFQSILVFVSSGTITSISIQRAFIITGFQSNPPASTHCCSTHHQSQFQSYKHYSFSPSASSPSSTPSSCYKSKISSPLNASSLFSTSPSTSSSSSSSSLTASPLVNWIRSDIILLTLIWITAITLSSPIFIYQTVHHINLIDTHTIPICGELWPPHGRSFYTLALILIQWACPLLTMILCHYKVDSFLRHHMETRVRLMCFNDMDSKQKGNLFYSKLVSTILTKRDIRDKLKRNTKVTRALFKNTVIFGLIWLPLNLTNLYFDFLPDDNSYQLSTTTIYLIQAISQTIAVLSPISNAYLYFWSNTNIRKQVKKYYLFNRFTGIKTKPLIK
ncbi:neuropeptide F receptor-like [Tetranychus urticae]|uniref:G-protein coupled receptors family 1 profile domain-containing protein n=1 Tax=Tetranychus urticae TaxID=32264 RepID=T1JZZ5_TETUR|nr:neuropeptide F receptor-like [Tetranychus urticae]